MEDVKTIDYKFIIKFKAVEGQEVYFNLYTAAMIEYDFVKATCTNIKKNISHSLTMVEKMSKKTKDILGFPALFILKGKLIYLWPTPDDEYICELIFKDKDKEK